MKNLILLLLFGVFISAQSIPTSRTFNSAWKNAGYPGEIPEKMGVSVKKFGAIGNGIADDSKAVLDTIAWIIAQQDAKIAVVYFPAGNYKITKTLRLPAGISLRGERENFQNKSTLTFDLNGKGRNCIEAIGKSYSFQKFLPASIHSSSIEVSNVAEFQAGDYAELRQRNDPSWDNKDFWAQHCVGQIVKITKVEGSRLHLERPLRANYQQHFNPEIRKIEPVTEVGVDNCIIDRVDQKNPIYGNHIYFKYAARCWVRGVELKKCVQRLIDMHHSTKIEISGCYFHHAYDYGGGGHAYGTECSFHTGECLIQNNIFVHLRHSMIVQAGSNGNV